MLLNHIIFLDTVNSVKTDVKELLRQNLSKQDFADKLNVLVRYYFWSKAEWEVIISSFIGNEEDKKVDIYNQIYLNWDKFVNYVWLVKWGCL